MKVALCVSGDIRELSPSIWNLKRRGADLYCSFWRNPSTFDKIEILRPQRVVLHDEGSFTMALVDELSRDKAQQLFVKDRAGRPRINTFKMFYHIYHCNKLIDKSYDVVIRMRTDTVIIGEPNFEIPPTILAAKRITEQQYNDHFAYGSQDVMNWYSRLWQDREGLYVKWGDDPYWMHPESTMKLWIHDILGLKTMEPPFDTKLMREINGQPPIR